MCIAKNDPRVYESRKKPLEPWRIVAEIGSFLRLSASPVSTCERVRQRRLRPEGREPVKIGGFE